MATAVKDIETAAPTAQTNAPPAVSKCASPSLHALPPDLELWRERFLGIPDLLSRDKASLPLLVKRRCDDALGRLTIRGSYLEWKREQACYTRLEHARDRIVQVLAAPTPVMPAHLPVCIVFKDVPGMDVHTFQKMFCTLPPAATRLNLAADVCDTVAMLHKCGIVHCDIKPENFVLPVTVAEWAKLQRRDDADAKADAKADADMYANANASNAPVMFPPPILIDFEFAGELPYDASGANIRGIGTEDFMAPEIQYLRGAVTPAADCYSLGVTVWEILAWTEDFPTKGHAVLQEANPESVTTGCGTKVLPLAVPKNALCIVCALMQKDPTRRMSASDAAIALRALRDAELTTSRATFTATTSTVCESCDDGEAVALTAPRVLNDTALLQ